MNRKCYMAAKETISCQTSFVTVGLGLGVVDRV